MAAGKATSKEEGDKWLKSSSTLCSVVVDSEDLVFNCFLDVGCID